MAFFLKLLSEEAAMDLFEPTGRRVRWQIRHFLPVFVLAVLFLVFYLGISVAGTEAVNKEQTTLKQALEQGAIRTYAMTGQYPQSLDELLNDYHITYDSDKFVVEYVPNSSNLLPSISVLILSSQKGGPS